MEVVVIYAFFGIFYYGLCHASIKVLAKLLVFNKLDIDVKNKSVYLLDLNYKHNCDETKERAYVIDKGVELNVFAPWFRWIKNKNVIVSIYEYLNFILPPILFMYPPLALGPQVFHQLALILYGVMAGIGAITFIRPINIIDTELHLNLIKALRSNDYKTAKHLLKMPEVRQNIHYNNDELAREIVKTNNIKVVEFLLDDYGGSASFSKRIFCEACSQPHKEKIIKKLCSKISLDDFWGGVNPLLDAVKHYDHKIINDFKRKMPKKFIPEALCQAVKDNNYETSKALLSELKNSDIIEKAYDLANAQGNKSIAKLAGDRLLYLAINHKLIKNDQTKSPFFKSLLNKFTPMLIQDKISFFKDPVTLEYTYKPTLVKYEHSADNQTRYRLYDNDVLQKIYKDTQLEIRELNYYIKYINFLIEPQQIFRMQELSKKLRVKEGPRKGDWIKGNEIVCPYTRLPIFMDQLKNANCFLSLFAYRSSKVKVDENEIADYISKCHLQEGKSLSDKFKRNPNGFFSYLSNAYHINGATALRVLEKAGIIKPMKENEQNLDEDPLSPKYWNEDKKDLSSIFNLFQYPSFASKFKLRF